MEVKHVEVNIGGDIYSFRADEISIKHNMFNGMFYTTGDRVTIAMSGFVGDMFKKPAYGIEKVIYNYPATIVFWNDGTKTVVKDERACTAYAKAFFKEPTKKYIEGKHAWREVGLLNAICKKLYGNRYIDELRRWC